MRALTRFFINRRDTAAKAWLAAPQDEQLNGRYRRSLELWDATLTAWTRNGTRWT